MLSAAQRPAILVGAEVGRFGLHDDLARLVERLNIPIASTLLGKSVIRANDTPNFIANRVGVFSLLATMQHTERFGLGLDTVDALPGLHNDPLFDAFFHQADRLRVVHPRHEQTAGDMALGAALWAAPAPAEQFGPLEVTGFAKEEFSFCDNCSPTLVNPSSFDPRGAVLELGNLPEWIQRGVGQRVGGRLVIAERHENGTSRRAVIGARVQDHFATTRLQRDGLAWSDAQGFQVQGVHQRHGIGFEGIEHRGASSHAARVPMFQLAARDQDDGELCIGTLVGRNDVGGDKSGLPPFAWEVIDKHHRLTWVTLGPAGIGHCMIVLQSIPGDTPDTGHGAAHLVKHFRHMRVVPIQTQTQGQLLNDPDVLASIARGLNRFASHLH